MPYTISVTLDTPSAQRISQDLAVITGVADLTSYNATHAEVTPITGKFKTTLAVVAESTTDKGYIVHWDRGTKAFKAFDTASTIGAAAADNTDVGAFNFIAIGLI